MTTWPALLGWPAGSAGAILEGGEYASYAFARRLGPGQEAEEEVRAAGRGVCILRLSPPTSGLDRSGRGARSWTGSLHPGPTPLVADSGLARSQSEGAAVAGAAGRGVCILRLSPPTSGLDRRGRRRGAQLDREFASYASRRRLWARFGGGSEGAAYETGSLKGRDYLACFAWLARWASWCDTGGPPSLHRPSSSRAQPVPSGQTSGWGPGLRLSGGYNSQRA